MKRNQPIIGFDPDQHVYKVDGRIVPSVTQIINFDKPSFYLDNGAAERGTIVHKLLEEHDLGVGMEFLYEVEYRAFLDQYREFLLDMNPVFEGIESPIHHAKLMYCGTIDRAGTINGIPFIADIKTGSSVPSWARLQTAAYAKAYYKDPEKVKRFVIHVNPRKLKSYRLYSYDNPADFAEWEWLCNQYHYRMNQLEEIR